MPGKLGLGEEELELHPTAGHVEDGMAILAPWLGVLCVGDYVSDVEIPWMHESGDLEAYRGTLARLAGLVERADVVVPGHGSPHTRERALELIDEDVELPRRARARRRRAARRARHQVAARDSRRELARGCNGSQLR